MAGDQQARFRQPGHAAAPTIATQHGSAKEVLLDALLGDDATRLAGEIFQAGALIGIEGSCWRLASRLDQFRSKAVALDGESFPVRVKLVPDFAVKRSRVAKSRSASRRDRRVEAGEIHQLHRYRARRAANQLRQFHDFSITTVQPAERQLAIQVKRELELFPSPAIISHVVLLVADLGLQFRHIESSRFGRFWKSGVSG